MSLALYRPRVRSRELLDRKTRYFLFPTKELVTYRLRSKATNVRFEVGARLAIDDLALDYGWVRWMTDWRYEPNHQRFCIFGDDPSAFIPEFHDRAGVELFQGFFHRRERDGGVTLRLRPQVGLSHAYGTHPHRDQAQEEKV
jgi:hypothetical protein